MVISQAIRNAVQYLNDNWKDGKYNHAPLDAQLIMCRILSDDMANTNSQSTRPAVDRLWLIKNYDMLLRDDLLNRFNELVDARARHMPLQYITGVQEFMSLSFYVNHDVLIPRADTEIVTECVIDYCEKLKCANVLDIGSGSGCISISIAHYTKQCRIFSVDVSADALNVARHNADILGVDDKIEFIHHDILEGFPPVHQTLDVIVSNPPYIKTGVLAHLQPEIHYEPRLALDGGDDGLKFYKKIIEYGQFHLKQGGLIAFEISTDVLDEMKEDCHFNMCLGLYCADVINDLAGLPRVLALTKR